MNALEKNFYSDSREDDFLEEELIDSPEEELIDRQLCRLAAIEKMKVKDISLLHSLDEVERRI
jgi:hypothetical protein